MPSDSSDSAASEQLEKLAKIFTDEYGGGDSIEYEGGEIIRKKTGRPLYEVRKNGEIVNVVDPTKFRSARELDDILRGQVARARLRL